MVFGDEGAPLNDDHKRRVTLIIILETFTGWSVEYAEQILEERPMIVNDMFALKSARKKSNDHEQAKQQSLRKLR